MTSSQPPRRGGIRITAAILRRGPVGGAVAHDKLLTARLLRRRDVAHPRTAHIRDGRDVPRSTRPVVLKPRFGSWGSEVLRCDDPASLAAQLARIREAGWYRRHGVLVQELVPPQGHDLRILVAAGRVVGAVRRVAAPGEWRTKVALGGTRHPVPDPPPDAVRLALEATRAIGAALVGVDLLPDGRGGWIMLELNGAVEFSQDYSASGDVFEETAFVLARAAHELREYGRAAFPVSAA